MKEELLPIGTVCLLKEAKKRVMIIGFLGMAKEGESKVYDYIGCLYPEGVLSSDQTLLFNHENIETIYQKGLSDDEEKDFKTRLLKFLSEGGNSETKQIESLIENSSVSENVEQTPSIFESLNEPIVTIEPESTNHEF